MVSLSRRQIVLLLVPLVGLLVVAGQRLAASRAVETPQAAEALVSVAGDVSGAAGRSSVPKLVLHISGAVVHPGLYRLDDGSRVADLVARAGGLKPRVDLTAVNLAAPLADGQHVIVPRRLPGGVGGASGASTTGAKVQLSAATLDQLDELPGIGPVTAQKIVDWRAAHGAFRSVDDLDQIPGIGPARVDQLRDLVVP